MHCSIARMPHCHTPKAFSFFLLNRSSSCSSLAGQSELRSLYAAQILGPNSQSCPSLDEWGLDRRSSLLSVDSMASTSLPSPSPGSTRSCSTTRIGGQREGLRGPKGIMQNFQCSEMKLALNEFLLSYFKCENAGKFGYAYGLSSSAG